MKPPMIDNGKTPDEPYNARLGFWLPPDSPYGNFQLKFMKIIERLDEANRRIIESTRLWETIHAGWGGILPLNSLTRHELANEEAIYMMRRAADELVSLIWCLSEYERTGSYPDVIVQDSLGCVLKAMGRGTALDIYQSHEALISVLNDVANAFKHSFINSDKNIVGSLEPRIHTLGLAYNRLAADLKFYDVSLTGLVRDFDAFYHTCVGWMSAYSVRKLNERASEQLVSTATPSQ
jgi:hypothetical protein